MLIDELKKQITTAMKSGDSAARDVLRLALSEIQAAAERKGTAPTDEDAVAGLRKLIKSNDETIRLSGEDERATVLRRENEILGALLPKSMSVDAIVAALAPVHDAMKAAHNDGQATGVAMKHLKAAGAEAASKDVGEAVKRVRAGT